MKGDKKPEDKDDVFKIDEWFSKVKLEGSKETIIRHDWLGTKNTMLVPACSGFYKKTGINLHNGRSI